MMSLSITELRSILWLTAKVVFIVAMMGSGVSSFIYQNF